MLSRQEFCCKHRHDGFQHPVCYLNYQKEEKGSGVGYLDIEASGLQADFNMIYSWVIKYAGKPRFESYVLQPRDYQNHWRDKEAIHQLLIALQKFDKILTYYGDDFHFDMPFLRTRALGWGFQFPPYKTIQHEDLYMTCKKKLKLHSTRLDSVAEHLHVKHSKTHIAAEIWNRASSGYDKEALHYILEHNKIDCVVLEEVHQIMRPYVAESRKWL